MVIHNVQLIDPTQGIQTLQCLRITDGRITCMEQGITTEPGELEIDGQGLLVSPGFIDAHAHVFGLDNSKGIASVSPDSIGVKQGVTMVVDAGSTGIDNYPCLKNESPSKTGIKFFVNVSRYGLQEGLSELADVNNLMTLTDLNQFQAAHGEDLVGIKVRMSGSVVKTAGLTPLTHARELSTATGLPLMVHIGNAPPALDEILNLLQAGDIVTHYMHGKPGGILDYMSAYRAAVARGVRFDIGHGSSSFCFETAKQLLCDSDVAFSISTDLYRHNLDKPVGSLALCMSKFLTLGMSLMDCVQAVTTLPASYLNIQRPTLAVGQPADLTLFRLVDGAAAANTTLIDSEGCEIPATQLIVPFATILGDTVTLV